MSGRNIKHDKIAHGGGRDVEGRERAVHPLACGHEPVGAPQLSNPERWWCGICRTFQTMRTHRKR